MWLSCKRRLEINTEEQDQKERCSILYLKYLGYFWTMTYKQTIDELRVNNIQPQDIPPNEGAFFDYEETPNEQLYDLFWTNAQKFLNDERFEQYFSNPRLYYNTNQTENAGAYVDGKYSLIVVFMGAIVPIYSYYHLRKNGFETEGLRGYNEVAEPFDITPDIYLFQVVTLFFLYHETGHLIQLNNQPRQYTEFVPNCKGSEEERHAKEFDADWFASNELAFHIVDLWASLQMQPEKEAIEFLHKMVELALAGIYVYLIKMSLDHPKLYFQEHCHPHPSVRLSYVIHYLVTTVKLYSGITINENKVLHNAMAISDELMADYDPNPVEYFSLDVIYQNLDEIKKYVDKIINDVKTKYPECCYNRLA